MKKISLAGARVSAGFSQEEIAEKLGVTRQTVNKWETGKTRIRTAQFIAFCKVTGFDEDDIFLPQESTLSRQ